MRRSPVLGLLVSVADSSSGRSRRMAEEILSRSKFSISCRNRVGSSFASCTIMDMSRFRDLPIVPATD